MYQEMTKDTPIVQKYGGTSVGTTSRIKDVAKRIAEQYKDGWTRMAIVVSAMTGETNKLVALVHEVNANPPAKAYDMAVASGEQVSVALMAAALSAEGISSEPFLSHQLGILTDDFHSKARIKSINTEKIQDCWSRGVVPVVAGFQGVTESLEITTLGRGGSDTSAVALAIAVQAGFCEINTDVDGVFSCDPRIVKQSKLIEDMDFEVALEMASLGSKVLHPRCVELGAKFQMPIVVRNTFTPNHHRRTRVMNLANRENLEAPTVSGVTLDRDVAKISFLNLPFDTKIVSGLFAAIAESGVNVDIIVHNMPEPGSKTMHLGFTTSKGECKKAIHAAQRFWSDHIAGPSQSGNTLQVSTEEDCAKVSVVGVGMRSHPGVAATTFETLSHSGIDIRMISTSEIKISCVIDAKHAESACQALHKAFVEI
ncbi:MAG: aspartate kinase [Proteobacteria bacterium]|nr:aspartate kinase [Pseudomonadota bacterium]